MFPGSLEGPSASTLFGLLGLLALAFAAFLGILGLRALRRGPARFWVGPGASALALWPLAFGTALAGASLRQALEGLALSGSGGIAAVAAGLAEALVALLAALFCTAGLGFVGLLAVGVGRARANAGAPNAPAFGWALQASALVALMLSASAVVLLVQVAGAVFASPQDPQAVLWRLRGAQLGSIALVFLLPAQALLVALRAERTAAPLDVKLVALVTLALCGLGSAAGFWAVKRRVDCLTATAVTGQPCDATETPEQMR